jgi:hypothetical protein
LHLVTTVNGCAMSSNFESIYMSTLSRGVGPDLTACAGLAPYNPLRLIGNRA